MTQPTLEDVRELSGWTPPLGVLSVYLGFDPADRTGAWRTELRNGLETILDAHREAEHEQRVALRATAKRLIDRFEDGDKRPPPRGEAGFVEVAEKGGAERWWGLAAAPAASSPVELGPGPVIAPLVELSCHGGPRAVALISSERVRLLRCADGTLEGLEEWELSINSLDWRERKSQSTNNPARAQGVSSSGHDQFGERLDHNRQRFLGECGRLAAGVLEENELEEILVFGPAGEVESFSSGFNSTRASLTRCGDGDLISTPTAKLNEVVLAAIERIEAERDHDLIERALGKANGGSRGAAGTQEARDALREGRVDHLVLDAAVGEEAEPLIRAALAGSSRVTVVRDEIAAPLAEAEGVAAILRY